LRISENPLLKGEIEMSSEGIVVSRECPLCGHHEIGYLTQDGIFHPLKPGTRIQTLEQPQDDVVPETSSSDFQIVPEEGAVDRSQYKVWIPQPLRGIQRCRLKYGVMVEETSFAEEISSEAYAFAYLEKLRRLIEKEIHTPIAVLLDRYFASPHLATGDSRQIARALWQELDEIKDPVVLVEDWLEKGDEESVSKMIYPVSEEGFVDQPVSEEEQHKELEDLSLEEFLGLL
jgi:hypothetical protein